MDARAYSENTMSEKPSNPKDIVGIRKTAFSALPMRVVHEASLGMMEGALKYGRHNYRGVGVRASVYFDATMRHLVTWWEGEDMDPDSKVHHVAKAITSLMVLRDAMLRDMMEDDRPPSSVDYSQELDKAAAALVDLHADKNPKHYTIKDAEFNLR